MFWFKLFSCCRWCNYNKKISWSFKYKKKKESEDEIKKYTDRLESTTEPELDDESKNKVNERIEFLKKYISTLDEASGILSTNEQVRLYYNLYFKFYI